MFEALLDPTKKIKANDTVIFTTSTGAVIVGTYFGTTDSKIIVKYPALIQSRSQMKDGKSVMNLFFSLLLPDSTCSYRARYGIFEESSIVTIETPTDDIKASHADFCDKVNGNIFDLTMGKEMMEQQDEYYFKLLTDGL